MASLTFPYSGRPGRVDAPRLPHCRRRPFMVVYRVTAMRVEIANILHGAQVASGVRFEAGGQIPGTLPHLHPCPPAVPARRSTRPYSWFNTARIARRYLSDNPEPAVWKCVASSHPTVRMG